MANDRRDSVASRYLLDAYALAFLGLIATAGTVVVTLWAGLYVGDRRCGGSGVPAPADGSALGTYCGFFEDSNETILVLEGLLFYAPTLIVLIGTAWASIRVGPRRLAHAVVAAAAWMLVLVLPAAFLPGS